MIFVNADAGRCREWGQGVVVRLFLTTRACVYVEESSAEDGAVALTLCEC